MFNFPCKLPNYGFTALMITCRYGYKNCIKILLENGSNPNIQNNSGWTALMLECQKGQKDCVKILKDFLSK